MYVIREEDILAHHGIKGQKWGVRRYQYEDGSLTAEGKDRYRAQATVLKSEHAAAKTMGKASNALATGMVGAMAAAAGLSASLAAPYVVALGVGGAGITYGIGKIGEHYSDKAYEAAMNELDSDYTKLSHSSDMYDPFFF